MHNASFVKVDIGMQTLLARCAAVSQYFGFALTCNPKAPFGKLLQGNKVVLGTATYLLSCRLQIAVVNASQPRTYADSVDKC